MKKISAIILTLNEEKNIERCINSLSGVADEIVVVDSFSTDTTEAICKSLQVRFIKHQFEGYVEQKNWALTQAQYPIVLSLDADEALSDELKQSILFTKANWHADAYSFNRLTSYCGKWIKHCGWYPDSKIRLWEIEKGHWGGSNPHDKVVMDNQCKIQHLKGDLLHYTFYSISEHVMQVNKFSEIKAKGKFLKGKRTNLFLILLNTIVKFIKSYFIKLGFLDGIYGFYICAISSFSTFLTYIKLYELQKKSQQ